MISKEALEKIKIVLPYTQYFSDFEQFYNDIELIKQDLERLEKLEKIIKIIKDKRFLTSFIAFALKCGYSLEKFNESISPFDALTEKEYALLVEEFGNENN